MPNDDDEIPGAAQALIATHLKDTLTFINRMERDAGHPTEEALLAAFATLTVLARKLVGRFFVFKVGTFLVRKAFGAS